MLRKIIYFILIVGTLAMMCFSFLPGNSTNWKKSVTHNRHDRLTDMAIVGQKEPFTLT